RGGSASRSLRVVWILMLDGSRAGRSRAVCISGWRAGRSTTLWDSAQTSIAWNRSHRSAWCNKAQGPQDCGVSLGEMATLTVCRGALVGAVLLRGTAAARQRADYGCR